MSQKFPFFPHQSVVQKVTHQVNMGAYIVLLVLTEINASPIADNYAGATGTGNGLYAKPLEEDEANAPPPPPALPSSTSSRLIFCRNGSDSDQWHHPNNNTAASDDLQSGYSAVYVANSNNLAESSFSTSSTSDHQARSCSRGHRYVWGFRI